GEPRREAPQGDNQVAGVVHLRWHRQLDAAGTGEQPHFIAPCRHADRQRRLPPGGEKRIERPGLEHGAGKQVGADRRSLFEYADAELGLALLQPDSAAQASWTGADDEYVVLHFIAFSHGRSRGRVWCYGAGQPSTAESRIMINKSVTARPRWPRPRRACGRHQSRGPGLRRQPNQPSFSRWSVVSQFEDSPLMATLRRWVE